MERLGGDQNLFCEVVEIFLEECPKQLESLRTAVASGNAADIERTAHSLKGELGYLGISMVSEKARELEMMGRTCNLEQVAEVSAQLESQILEVLILLGNTESVNVSEGKLGKGQ